MKAETWTDSDESDSEQVNYHCVKEHRQEVHEPELIDRKMLVGALPRALRRLLPLLHQPARAKLLGLRVPNVLLVGQPGTGKTAYA